MSPLVITAANAHVAPTIRSPMVLDRSQHVHAVHGERRRAGALDLRAHLHQHPAQVGDLRLTRGVVDHRRALGQHGGHQDVLRRAHAREVQPDLGATQVVRRRDDATVFDLTRGAELAQAALVHVQRTGADRVTAGQCHHGPLAPADQRP
jgi:hypothetical protein